MGNKRNWDEVGDIIAKIKELGLTYKDGAEQFGIKPGVLYEYNRQHHGDGKGPKSTIEKSHKSRSSLPEEVKGLIVDYRKRNADHGFKRIQDELKKKHLVVVTRKQIRSVLKDSGLLEVLDSSFDRQEEPAKGERRFEADYPGELYQMDVTYVYITGIPVLYLVVIIDDNSRFCLAAELCKDQKGETLLEVLHNAITLHDRKPLKLLTDQGRGFYTWSMEQTIFQNYLDDMGIEHIVSEPHSPQTCGKVERLIQTIKTELLHKVRFSGYEEARRGIEDFIRSYNFERPHQGIGGGLPSDRFYGVVGEISRVESELVNKKLDKTKGYLVYKVHDHTVSVVCSGEGLQVYLDGTLLKEDADHGA